MSFHKYNNNRQLIFDLKYWLLMYVSFSASDCRRDPSPSADTRFAVQR
jgi:hypothetical protein